RRRRFRRTHQHEMSKQSYRDLVAWQRAMDLADEIYACARDLPKYELFALASQMRRAAVSIPCNIAEGHGRYNLRDFRHFIRVARGSALELETEIIIAARQDYFGADKAEQLLKQTAIVGRLINGLIRHITKVLNEEQRTEN